MDRLELGGRIRVVVADRAEHARPAQAATLDDVEHLGGGRVVVEPVYLGHVEADQLEVAGGVNRPRGGGDFDGGCMSTVVNRTPPLPLYR
jgi:hypothetical protein